MISIFVQIFVRNMVLAPVPTATGPEHCAVQHESWKISGMTRYDWVPAILQCNMDAAELPTVHGKRSTAQNGPKTRATARNSGRVRSPTPARLKRPTVHGPRLAVRLAWPTAGGAGLISLIQITSKSLGDNRIR
jgi:hypothetical protein